MASLQPLNNLSAVAPFRLDRSQALTCDNDNKYKDEQTAYNSGQVNLFPTTTSGTTEVVPGTPARPI